MNNWMSIFPSGVNKFYADIKLIHDKLNGYKNLKSHFLEKVGYELNLESPRSYNEKIVWKKLNDRNPLIPVTADKFEVRSYVKNVLGRTDAKKILIPIYNVASDPSGIPFEYLPDNYVVKPNHGSHMHMVVLKNERKNIPAIRSLCRKWLKVNYGLFHYEWAYQEIKRKIIVEQLLLDNDGKLPLDYKLYCFHGECKYIRVSRNRLGREDHSAYFDPDWNHLPVSNPGYKVMAGTFTRPVNLEELVSTAEKLSEPFDAVRIDLYICNGKIYFGEITHYDGSGLARFEPEKFDFEMGSNWNVKPEYWKTSVSDSKLLSSSQNRVY
jgi:hypothetical protein